MDTTSRFELASSITRCASFQTFSTIRFLVDHERVVDAYCAYAYFRWVDDNLDSCPIQDPGRVAFIERQQQVLERASNRLPVFDACPEEDLLVGVLEHDLDPDSGLRKYLFKMMQVMSFDARRRGQLISQDELDTYTHNLAVAVTEAMHYYIGHTCSSPNDRTRYLAVTAAHITHMLRDMDADVKAGYFNIPREYLEANHIQPQDIQAPAYRRWVKARVDLARAHFRSGHSYLMRVQSPRCRLAGIGYASRFEWLLDAIEKDDFILRPIYQERRAWTTALRMLQHSLVSLMDFHRADVNSLTPSNNP